MNFFMRANYRGGQGYSAEAQAVFANMDSQPPTDLKAAMARFVDTCVADGNWDKIVDFVKLDIDTEENSLSGWKGVIGASLSSAEWNKYTYSATRPPSLSVTTHIKTGIVPSTISGVSLNSFGVGIFLREKLTDNVGVLGAGGTKIWLSETVGTNVRFCVNGGVKNYTGETSLADNAHYCIERTDSNTVRLLKNGVLLSSQTDAATLLTDNEMYLGASNNNGAVSGAGEARFRAYYVYNPTGFNHEAFNAALVQLNNDIDALISYILVYFQTLSQSNGVGQAETSRLVLTSYSASDLNAEVFYKPTNGMTLDGIWQKLRVGEGESSNNLAAGSTTKTNFGVEVPLSHLFGSVLPDGVLVKFIKSGWGGTQLQQDGTLKDWSEASVNEYFDQSINAMFTPAIERLQADHPGKEIRVVIESHQGENDSLDDTKTANYGSNLSAYVSAVRASNALLANAPWLFTLLKHHASVNEGIINAAISDYVASNQNCYLIDATTYTPISKQDLSAEIKAAYPPTTLDDKHWNYGAQINKGELIFNKIVEIGYI